LIRELSSPLNNYHGTAQQGRLAAALQPEHVSVDERTLADLLAYAAMYARKIKYYNLDGLSEDPETGEQLNWSGFFEKDETVFLATLLASDIHEADEAIQAAFLNIHQLSVKKDQVDNFNFLIEKLLDLTGQLFEWHDKSLHLHDSKALDRFAKEIDRAMRGELGLQLYGLLQIVEKFIASNSFPKAPEWQETIKGWLRGWPREHDLQALPFPEYTESSFDDLLHFSGARLQEYYRRLYFTRSFLDELIPDLFAQSIKEKHNHEPDIGLLIAFLRLFSHTQEELNGFSGRHLAYYNKEVLGRKIKPGTPDRAVICFQSGLPKEGVIVPRGSLLLAGVNGEGLPSYYQTLKNVYVSRAVVAAVKTVYVSKNPLVSTNSSYRLVTAIYAAPHANSADGLGGEFTGKDQSWPVLGEDQFDLGIADRQMGTSILGFAIASSCLQLTSGERKVTVRMQFTAASFTTLVDLLDDIAENAGEDSNSGDIFNTVFNRPFRIFLTEEVGWMPITKYIILPPEAGRVGHPVLTLQFILPTSAAPVFGYSPSTHGGGFRTSWPVLKVLLSDEEPLYCYSFLRDLELEEIALRVNVEGIRNLAVYNDLGLLDASRPFVPFGPQPKKGSYLLVGHPEIFNKHLLGLDIEIEWGDLPESEDGFSDYYKAYDKDITNESFKFTLSALSDFSFSPKKVEEREEFNLFTTELMAHPPLTERTKLTLDQASLKKLQLYPLHGLTELEEFSNTSRSGYLKLEISQPKIGFGHSLFPRLFAQKMAENARPRPFSLVAENAEPLALPNEPYTPVINRLSVNYNAQTTINLRRTELKENSQEADDRIFGLHPFGTELIYANGNLKTSYLLPNFEQDGYLFIGIDNLRTDRLLSLYFDIEDSKKKISRRSLDIHWHYLQDDEWQPFSPDQIISDSTVMFSTRGIVQIHCPAEMSKGGELMDPSLHWIRVSASGNLNIPGRCKGISPHAVEVEWVDNDDENHLETPPEGRPPISGLANQLAGITGVQQLRSFYGSRPAESEEVFYVRGSERLRHKNRAVNAWDFERLILEKFPDIHQVKCIGRHGYEDVLPIGRVLIVVIPQINGTDISPTVGFHVLSDIEQFLRSLCGPFVDFRVINPIYEPLKISCSVKLHEASIHHEGLVWSELHSSITDFVCPWLKEGILQLGASISKTEILALP